MGVNIGSRCCGRNLLLDIIRASDEPVTPTGPLSMFFVDLSLIAFDYTDVNAWNANYGWDFTTIVVDLGLNYVELSGGTVNGLTIGASAFQNDTNITDFVDTGGYFTSIGVSAFQGCISLIGVLGFANCTSIGDYAFEGCVSNGQSLRSGAFGNVVTIGEYAFANNLTITSPIILNSCTSIGQHAFELNLNGDTVVTLPVLTSLGGTTGDDSVFLGWIGSSDIQLTIPAALLTNNGGNPDGDIQYLQANNTVTIIPV